MNDMPSFYVVSKGRLRNFCEKVAVLGAVAGDTVGLAFEVVDLGISLVL